MLLTRQSDTYISLYSIQLEKREITCKTPWLLNQHFTKHCLQRGWFTRTGWWFSLNSTCQNCCQCISLQNRLNICEEQGFSMASASPWLGHLHLSPFPISDTRDTGPNPAHAARRVHHLSGEVWETSFCYQILLTLGRVNLENIAASCSACGWVWGFLVCFWAGNHILSFYWGP